MKRAGLLIAFVVLVASMTPVAQAGGADDVPALGEGDGATDAWTVLPPGNGYFTGPLQAHVRDQLHMYDGFDDPVADGTFTADDFPTYFKDGRLGVDAADIERTETPRDGVRIHWDDFGVPHVYGEAATDVAFGAGWATAESRLLIAEAVRLLGRLGVFEIAEGDISNPFGNISGRPINYTDAELEAAIDNAIAVDPEMAAEVLPVIDAYVDGMNAWLDAFPPFGRGPARLGIRWPRWRRVDVVASAMTMAAFFGQGGGGELANARALRVLTDELGAEMGRRVFDYLRAADDPHATTHVADIEFPYPVVSDGAAGTRSPDAAVDPAAVALADTDATFVRPPAHASNWLLVGGAHTANGHPILAGGPQMGYVFPEMPMEIELRGGGIDASGMTVPGLGMFVLVGHTPDYAWSITAGSSDLVDIRVEELCEPDGAPPRSGSMHYRFEGECIAMQSVRGGLPRTVHGPVIERGDVDGAPVAISHQRASRGWEALAARAFWRLNTGQVQAAADVPEVLDDVAFSVNVAYLNATEIAYAHTGRYPVRAAGVDPDLPTWGTGEWEWEGTLDWRHKPHAINPAQGYLASWNNKVARGWRNADSVWGFGPYQRVDMIANEIERTIESDASLDAAEVAAVMQRTASRDLRGDVVVPALSEVLGDAPAPTPELADVRRLLAAWHASGSHRRDRDRDYFYDDAAVAIADRLVPALLEELLDPLVAGFAADLPLPPVDTAPASNGSAFDAGRASYLLTELRRVSGDAAGPAPAIALCDDTADCRARIWRALDTAYRRARHDIPELFRSDLRDWRKPAVAERMFFLPYLIPDSMRWTNRATWQQVVSFGD